MPLTRQKKWFPQKKVKKGQKRSKTGKKKLFFKFRMCFFFLKFPFFPRISMQATQSPKKKSPKKGQKQAKKQFFKFWRCFFFPKKIWKHFVFFFPGKVYTSLTHSFSEGGKKKKQHWKKKTPFSLTHSILAEKWSKMNFSGEIKKYGTFGYA